MCPPGTRPCLYPIIRHEYPAPGFHRDSATGRSDCCFWFALQTVFFQQFRPTEWCYLLVRWRIRWIPQALLFHINHHRTKPARCQWPSIPGFHPVLPPHPISNHYQPMQFVQGYPSEMNLPLFELEKTRKPSSDPDRPIILSVKNQNMQIFYGCLVGIVLQ